MSTQTIHLRGDLLSQIKQKASENERSISSEIAYRLKISLSQEKKEPENQKKD
jgi:hypothetical protein